MNATTSLRGVFLGVFMVACGSVAVRPFPEGDAATDAPSTVDAATVDRPDAPPVSTDVPVVRDVTPPTDAGRTCTGPGQCPNGTECFGGQGCGVPWTCVPMLGRACTADYAPFCGCDGQTFHGSSSCPDRPWASRGDCPGDADAGPPPAGCNLGNGTFCAVGATCVLGPCASCFCQAPGRALCTGGCPPDDGGSSPGDGGIAPFDARASDVSLPPSCPPQDIRGQGFCALFLGYAWDGAACVGVGGCSCVGTDCASIYRDLASCDAAHAACARPL